MKLTEDLLDILDVIVIEHPLFRSTITPVLTHIQLGSRGRISLVVGPTGVGKTTLIRFCEKQLHKYISQNPNCGYGPPLILEALSLEAKTFNWKSFYINALRKMNEPGLYAKVDLERCVNLLKKGKRGSSLRHFTQHQLRELFEQAVEICNPIAIFIDEIQHITKCNSIVRKADNLDVIKSLSNTTSSTFILAGTYEARSMMYYGGQLSRRVNIIHFKRYQQAHEGVKIYAQIIKTIANKYDVPISGGVINNILYLYNHSIGCVGILVSWITQATEIAIKSNSKTLNIEHFKKTRLNNIQLSSIFNETISFEIEHDDESDFNPQSFMMPQAAQEDEETERKKNRLIKKLNPGTRKPHRDPILTF